MNCDQAFEHLTDPMLSNDPELLLHLEICRRCRQMRETLEPALSLIADDIDLLMESEWEDSYWRPEEESASMQPIFSSETVRLAGENAAELALWSSTGRDRVRFPRQGLWQYAAVFALGAFFAFGSVILWSEHQKTMYPSIQSTPILCTWEPQEEWVLAGTRNPSESVLACATCHLAIPDETNQKAVSHVDQLVRSCVACHVSKIRIMPIGHRPCKKWGMSDKSLTFPQLPT